MQSVMPRRKERSAIPDRERLPPGRKFCSYRLRTLTMSCGGVGAATWIGRGLEAWPMPPRLIIEAALLRVDVDLPVALVDMGSRGCVKPFTKLAILAVRCLSRGIARLLRSLIQARKWM